MEPDNVIFEIQDQIGIIRLSSPDGNQISRPEFILQEDLHRWIVENKLKGLMIAGKGRHFSPGADLSSVFSDPFLSIAEQEMQKGKNLLEFISMLNIPVFCAIKGVCFGGGLEIALASHGRIAHPKSLFAFPEVNQHLMPGLGGTVMATERTGTFGSMQLILGGDMLSAEEALKLRIIDRIEEDPEKYCLTHLRKMTEDRPQKVIHFIMQAIHNVKKLPREEALREETRMFCELAREEGARRRQES